MRDLVTGTFLTVLMAVLLREAWRLPAPRYEPLGAVFLAVVVPGTILVFALILIVRGWREWRRATGGPGAGFVSTTNLRFAATLATAFAWVLAMQLGLSFGVATFCFVIVCAAVLGAPRTTTAMATTVCVAGILSFGVSFIFARYLDVLLP
jgi:hypothetical protein